MTNADLQAFIATHGNKMFAINLDNTRTIFLGYKDSPTIDDIRFETVGTTDFFFVSRKNLQTDIPVFFEVGHVTECIQWIGIMKDGSERYLPDPMLFK